MPIGKVKWFNSEKGYGFVISGDGKDVFVHYTSIEGTGFRALAEGELVDYEPIQSEKGLKATKVTRLTKPGAAAEPAAAQPAAGV